MTNEYGEKIADAISKINGPVGNQPGAPTVLEAIQMALYDDDGVSIAERISRISSSLYDIADTLETLAGKEF